MFVFILSSVSAILILGDAASAAMPTFRDASRQVDFEVLAYDQGGDGFYGAGWLDHDRDGDLDLFLADGVGRPNGLFRNNGDGTFTEITDQAGVAGTGSSQVLTADFDSDGWTDVLVTGDGGVWGQGGIDTPVRIWFNNGDGTFTDHTASAGISMPGTSTPATAGDIDGDGDLDIYIGSAGSVETLINDPNALFLNNGDRTFTDISASAGIDTTWGACAATFMHLDDDDKIDLLVANCSAQPCCEPGPFEAFINNGDNTFTDRRGATGLWKLGYWMGLSFADYDRNGHMDFFATNTKNFGHGLYLNQGDGTWVDRAQDAGVFDWEFGWGTVSEDFDNDGNVDIYYIGAFPEGFREVILGPGEASPGHLFENRGDGTFEAPVQPLDMSCMFTTGMAAADYDNNGFTDVVVVTAGTELDTNAACPVVPGNTVLLRNEGNGNHWLTVALEGTTSNAGGVGATIRVVTKNRQQVRMVTAGSSFVSTDSPWKTFGLRDGLAAQVCVEWPEGQGEAFGWFEADQLVTLVQGAGTGVVSCDAAWRGAPTLRRAN